MTRPETIVCEIYDAWRAQDLEWLASYLPDDFCHVIHIPTDIHPLGGISRGKTPSVTRLAVIADDFDFLRGLLVHIDRAGVEIPIRYRHRETGAEFETTIANFWTFEDGWPVKLTEYHDIARIQAFNQTLAALTGPAVQSDRANVRSRDRRADFASRPPFS